MMVVKGITTGGRGTGWGGVTTDGRGYPEFRIPRSLKATHRSWRLFTEQQNQQFRELHRKTEMYSDSLTENT